MGPIPKTNPNHMKEFNVYETSTGKYSLKENANGVKATIKAKTLTIAKSVIKELNKILKEDGLI